VREIAGVEDAARGVDSLQGLSCLNPASRAQRGRLIILAQKMLEKRSLAYELQCAPQPSYRANIDT
jgi:hypothetical protein